MAYLSVPSRRGSLFQQNKSSEKFHHQRLAQKAAEYYNRNTRSSNVDDQDHITLNIGGKLFQTRKSTLRNVPDTKLARLDEDCENFHRENGEYFFDRNPMLFDYVLDYYRTGSMHIPRNVCVGAVKDELKFWDLGDGCISECCRKFYFDVLDEYSTYEMVKMEFYNLPTYKTTDATRSFHGQKSGFNWERFKKKAWVFIDNHESSLSAKVFATVYYGLIMLSIVSVFLSTLSQFRVPSKPHYMIRPSDYVDDTSSTNGTSNATITQPDDSLIIIDEICMLFFTIEFIFRFTVCPSIVERLRSVYTWLDVLYLVPVWTKFIIELTSPVNWHASSMNFFFVLDAVEIFRVFRIFRLSRHYRGLRVLLLSIRASVSELLLLFIFVSFALTIYASFVYCAEHHAGSGFDSIFISLWWALITMTTVGYGDYYPITTFGYLVAVMCALTGIIIIGMVVPIIAGNFHLYYGFRHAGSEDVELEKPEFVPPENENPLPGDCGLDTSTYRPKKHTFSPQLSLRESSESMTRMKAFQNLRISLKDSSGSITSRSLHGFASGTNQNGNCYKITKSDKSVLRKFAAEVSPRPPTI